MPATPGALVTRFGDGGLEIACPSASLTRFGVFGPRAATSETRLRKPFVTPAPIAGSASAGVLASSVASSALESFTASSFAAETCTVVVDWAYDVLANHRWSPLVPLSTRPMVLSEQKLEDSQ